MEKDNLIFALRQQVDDLTSMLKIKAKDENIELVIQGASTEDKLKCEEFSRKYLVEQAENVKLRNL